VFWVERGVLSRVPVPTANELDLDLAFAPDGTLLVATCDFFGEPGRRVPSAVWRVAPGRPPALVAGRAGKPASSGDGGPATAHGLSVRWESMCNRTVAS
jgi:hypothetical protein